MLVLEILLTCLFYIQVELHMNLIANYTPHIELEFQVEQIKWPSKIKLRFGIKVYVVDMLSFYFSILGPFLKYSYTEILSSILLGHFFYV